MLSKIIDGLKDNPRRLMFIAGGTVLVLIVFVGVCTMASGGEEVVVDVDFDPSIALPSVSLEEQVAEQVALTVQASVPTATPVPTPDVPATLAAEAEDEKDSRERKLNPILGAPVDDQSSVEQYSLTISDDRFVSGMGLPIWLSVRVHLEIERIFEMRPSDFLNSDDAGLVLEWMEYDIDRALREIESLDNLRGSLSSPVRGYGRYMEEMVLISRESVSKFRSMYQMANEREGVGYEGLTPSGRSEVDELYFDVKQNSKDFVREMSRYGCAACGELYRGRSNN